MSCETCAFRDGAEANKEPYNRLRAEIAALSGVPFYCHHGGEHWRKISGAVRGMIVAPGEEPMRLRVCAGWRRRVGELAEAGLFRKHRLVRHAVGEAAMALVEEVVKTDDRAAKPEMWRRLRQMVKSLSERSNNRWRIAPR